MTQRGPENRVSTLTTAVISCVMGPNIARIFVISSTDIWIEHTEYTPMGRDFVANYQRRIGNFL